MKELLNEIDELLSRFEDFTHGEDGENITKLRGKIELALSTPSQLPVNPPNSVYDVSVMLVKREEEITDEDIYKMAYKYVYENIPSYEKHVNQERLRCFSEGVKQALQFKSPIVKPDFICNDHLLNGASFCFIQCEKCAKESPIVEDKEGAKNCEFYLPNPQSTSDTCTNCGKGKYFH